MREAAKEYKWTLNNGALRSLLLLDEQLMPVHSRYRSHVARRLHHSLRLLGTVDFLPHLAASSSGAQGDITKAFRNNPDLENLLFDGALRRP